MASPPEHVWQSLGANEGDNAVNWIWQHSRFKTTAAQQAGLTQKSWTWSDLVTYATIL